MGESTKAKRQELCHSAKDQHMQEQLDSVNEELKWEKQKLLSVQEVGIIAMSQAEFSKYCMTTSLRYIHL